MNDAITARAFHQAEGLEDRRVLGEGACIFFRTASFAESVRLVQAIRDIPGIEDHPPAADIRAGNVTVRLISVADDYFGMTQRDVHVARRISAVGRGPRRSGPCRRRSHRARRLRARVVDPGRLSRQ